MGHLRPNRLALQGKSTLATGSGPIATDACPSMPRRGRYGATLLLTDAGNAEVSQLVSGDPWMMRVLCAAEELDLPDWWIGAGFLRNAAWDWCSNRLPRHDTDVDLVYFDATNCQPQDDWRIDEIAKLRFPFADWQIRNQARMHLVDRAEPYRSTAEGISHWVETATCVAVRLRQSELEFLFCYGPEDLLEMVARPIPSLLESGRTELFNQRLETKGWRKRWPGLRVIVENP